MLLYIGHDHASQWRDVLRVAGHAEILSEEIDAKGCPFRIPQATWPVPMRFIEGIGQYLHSMRQLDA